MSVYLINSTAPKPRDAFVLTDGEYEMIRTAIANQIDFWRKYAAPSSWAPRADLPMAQEQLASWQALQDKLDQF